MTAENYGEVFDGPADVATAAREYFDREKIDVPTPAAARDLVEEYVTGHGDDPDAYGGMVEIMRHFDG